MAKKRNRRKPHKRGNSALFPMGISPFAPEETKRVARVPLMVASLLDIIRGGISPRFGDSTAWYDRMIRVIGGALILIVLGAGLVMIILDRLHGK